LPNHLTLSRQLDEQHRQLNEFSDAKVNLHEVTEFYRWGYLSDPSLVEANTAYAKASCKEFSERLLTLPRELRDMIYGQLWNRDPPPLGQMVWPNRAHTWQTRCSGPPCMCLEHLPHFIDLNFVGAQVAYEMLDALKRVAAKYIRDYTVNAGELQNFCTADVFHVGMTREEVLRRMDLTISMGQFIYGDEKTLEETQEILEEDIEEVTGLLQQMPFEKPRAITFNITHDHAKAVNLAQVLQSLQPTFEALREKGFQMRLHYINHNLDIDWQLGSAVWGWSVEDWRKNMRKLGDLNVGFSGLVQVSRISLPHPRPLLTSIKNSQDPEKTLTEEQYKNQDPTWDIIARHLYGINMDM
jgi:hypothetical protein